MLSLVIANFDADNAVFSPDGRLVAVTAGTIGEIWDFQSRRRLATLRGHENPIHSIAFSPDGTRIVTDGEDYTVRVWDVSSGHQMAVLTAHQERSNDAACSPDGRWIVSGSHDNTARLWSVGALTAPYGELLQDA